MRVDPKRLVARMNASATSAIEAAIGRAVTAEHAEVGVDHFALALIQSADPHVAALIADASVHVPEVVERLEESLRRQRPRTEARPVFGPSLFRWVEDSWLFGSIEYGLETLPPSVLLIQLARNGGEYTATDMSGLTPVDLHVRRGHGSKYLDAPRDGAPETRRSGGTNRAGGEAKSEALERFCRDFTQDARSGKIDRVYGRHREIRQLIDILARRRKNNPLIVGEPGVGKTALVEGLAHAIVDGDVPSFLRETDLLGLDLGLLQAGASVRGEFEKRLRAVIDEVRSAARPTILFVDEAHALIGAGGPQGGGDAANLLKPALARGELRTIAATTWAEYKKYFEKDAALERRFQPVKVEEPSAEDTAAMLRGLRPLYESAHQVDILDEAIEAAARLAERYVVGRRMPDKAVDLLDTAAARVRVDADAPPEELSALAYELECAERHLGVAKRDAELGRSSSEVSLEALEARVAELRKTHDAAAEAFGAARDSRREDPVRGVVDLEAVARTVASWTGIPVGRMTQATQGTALRLESILRERVIGQETAVRSVAEAMRIALSGLEAPEAPLATMLFVGPSGVGKTETAHALAEELFGGASFLTVINMTEFTEKHSVSRLIGSPPGYVGYGEGGILTEAVRRRPYGVVLLDECEKADPEVMNLFYQVFDKGVLSDGEGQIVSFENTVVIMTSNLATDVIMSMSAGASGGEPASAEAIAAEIRPVLSRHFKPALLGRMQVVPFRALERPELSQIARLKIARLSDRVQSHHGVRPSFDDRVVEALVQRCDDPDSGARNLDAVLAGRLLPSIARALLEATAEEKQVRSIAVTVDESLDFQVDLTTR